MDEDNKYLNDVICPYCKKENDPRESDFFQNGFCRCLKCRKVFGWEKHVTVSYRTWDIYGNSKKR